MPVDLKQIYPGPLRLILAGSYYPENLHSMERYERLLYSGMTSAGVNVSLMRPMNVFGRLPIPRKLSGLLDKFLVFPIRLKRSIGLNASQATVVHVLDQANSLYARRINRAPHVVTCHDLIAARAALDRTPYASGSKLGRAFHSLNVRALQSAHTVVCVSKKTMSDCQRTFDASSAMPVLKRVYNCLAPGFDAITNVNLTQSAGRPFLLHVGNSAWYKNRIGLLSIYANLVTILPEPPDLHLYGAPLTAQERQHSLAPGLLGKVFTHESPSDEEVKSAYLNAQALIFPSLEEGFGWPPLEAMACGCPVFASNRQPLTEIGGDAIDYIDPEAPHQAAAHIASRLQLGESWRMERGAAGRARAADFSVSKFTSEMLAVYESVLSEHHQV